MQRARRSTVKEPLYECHVPAVPEAVNSYVAHLRGIGRTLTCCFESETGHVVGCVHPCTPVSPTRGSFRQGFLGVPRALERGRVRPGKLKEHAVSSPRRSACARQAVWKMACYTHFPRCNDKDKDRQQLFLLARTKRFRCGGSGKISSTMCRDLSFQSK